MTTFYPTDEDLRRCPGPDVTRFVERARQLERRLQVLNGLLDALSRLGPINQVIQFSQGPELCSICIATGAVRLFQPGSRGDPRHAYELADRRTSRPHAPRARPPHRTPRKFASARRRGARSSLVRLTGPLLEQPAT